jgi:general L-amino acid transport system substrate-binding protein
MPLMLKRQIQRMMLMIALAAITAFGLPDRTAQAGSVLDRVTRAGVVRCGVSEGIPGFSIEREGRWGGLDVDYCRALAMALFGNADAVQFTALNVSNRFQALREGRIDVLSRNSTWTIAREADFGIAFVGILFFDGQGFLARKASGARYALELDQAKVCVKLGTNSERNLANYFARHEMSYSVVNVTDFNAMKEAFEAGVCDVVSSDQSQLHALRAGLKDPGTARVLPEFISKEPLSPAMPASDPQWLLLGRLVLAMLINTEEQGINSKNVAQVVKVAKSEQVRGLLDLDGRFVKLLGLRSGWAQQTLESLGNYGEIFQRNLGPGTKLNLRRGQNALWNQGGLLYAPRVN